MKTTFLCTTASMLCVVICVAAQTSFGQIRFSRAGLNVGLAERLEMFGIFPRALLFFINNDIYLTVSQEPGVIRRSRALTHKNENHSTKLSGRR